jgi:thiamine-phosphate pyrophosphorylase
MTLPIPRFYAILDVALLRIPAASLAEALVSSGVALLQYRDKQASARRMLSLSRQLVSILHRHDCRFVVNDRPDVAVLAGADGVHVGQEDLGVQEARSFCGESCWVGVSTHNLEQVREADATAADYVAVGPIFPTSTKEHPDPVVGVDFIRRAREITRKPLVAIGGISLENVVQVWRAGADSAAVARDLLLAPDPAVRAGEFLKLAAAFSASHN